MPMKCKLLAAALCLALLLSGCGSDVAPDAGPTTEPTVPAPTTPADGDPGNSTCKGSYTVSDEEILAARDTVVAEMGDAHLTNGELQLYYWLEVAAFRASGQPVQPDYSQSLDTQSCPIDDSVNSWQQYFLRNALSAWHARKALVQMSVEEGVPAYDPEYKPDLEKRKEYMSDMPATSVLYQWSDRYQPNRLHQAYLDSTADTLNTLASDKGFSDSDAMAKAIAGAGADDRNLISYTQTMNHAYMYFTEMGYYFEPTAEEIEAYYQTEMSADQGSTGKTVDIRHILLIPQNAQVAADGTVTASEEDWARCETEAKNLLDKWKKEVNTTKFAQFAEGRVPEARFSELAQDHSQDAGSAVNGGRYVQVAPGQLLPELDAWCFDAARQSGDCEILRTAAGYHLVFLSTIHEDRYTDAENRLLRSLYDDLVQEAVEKYPVATDYSAISLGTAPDGGASVTPSDLLYPDVAHERFPDMPLYLQQDYPDAPFGNYKVSTHGCGITTLAMVASYLADDELTPAELAAQFGYYCGVRGSEICMFDDAPAEMGFLPKGRSYSWTEMDEALDNGQVVVSLQYYGYWTSGGHYIAMIDRTEDEGYVVRDSNLLNYKRHHDTHKADRHSRGSISQSGQYYWIYEPKVTVIPACTRCGENSAPEILLNADYTCEKCLTATLRRNHFLNGLAG